MTQDERWTEALAFRPRLLRLALSRVRSWHDAEDAVSEAFARIPKAPDDLDVDRFHGWLAVVVLNVIKDSRRGQPTADDLARVAYAEPYVAPDHAERIADQAEGAWLWERGLRALPPKRRRVMRAMREPGSAVQAVAAELGSTYGEAQTELARTRRPLRDLLERSRHIGTIPAVTRIRVRVLAFRSRLATAVPAFVLPALVVAPFLGHTDRQVVPPTLAPSPTTTPAPSPGPLSARLSPDSIVARKLTSVVVLPILRSPSPVSRPRASTESQPLHVDSAPKDMSQSEFVAWCSTHLLAMPQAVGCATPTASPG